MDNIEIRNAIRRYGVFGYQVADKLGMNECSFSRMLRKELPEEKKLMVLKAIKDVVKEREEEE